MTKFILKIWRGTSQNQYWEEFVLDRAPGENVISALMTIQKKPGESRRARDYASGLGTRVPGGSLWIVLHAHQWQA